MKYLNDNCKTNQEHHKAKQYDTSNQLKKYSSIVSFVVHQISAAVFAHESKRAETFEAVEALFANSMVFTWTRIAFVQYQVAIFTKNTRVAEAFIRTLTNLLLENKLIGNRELFGYRYCFCRCHGYRAGIKRTRLRLQNSYGS